MIAVIFEVYPESNHEQEYFDIAASLASQLRKIDGFISIERFQSLTDAGKILSLSFWRDEQAVEEWRNLQAHRAAQAKGRAVIFRDYRLRVAAVVRDYGKLDRESAPADSRELYG